MKTILLDTLVGLVWITAVGALVVGLTLLVQAYPVIVIGGIALASFLLIAWALGAAIRES